MQPGGRRNSAEWSPRDLGTYGLAWKGSSKPWVCLICPVQAITDQRWLCSVGWPCSKSLISKHPSNHLCQLFPWQSQQKLQGGLAQPQRGPVWAHAAGQLGPPGEHHTLPLQVHPLSCGLWPAGCSPHSSPHAEVTDAAEGSSSMLSHLAGDSSLSPCPAGSHRPSASNATSGRALPCRTPLPLVSAWAAGSQQCPELHTVWVQRAQT